MSPVEYEQGQRDPGKLVTRDGQDLRQPQRAELAYREDRAEGRLGGCAARSWRAQRGPALRAGFRADGYSSVCGLVRNQGLTERADVPGGLRKALSPSQPVIPVAVKHGPVTLRRPVAGGHGPATSTNTPA